MTDRREGTVGPVGPPWSVDVLADLHAGVLDPAESTRLWPLVNADPDARAVLAALDEVKVGLGQLGNAPIEPMPAQYASALDAAIEAEVRASGRVATAAPPAAAPAPVIDLAAARKRRNRMAAWGVGVLTAAAAAVAITFVALPGNETGGTPSAEGNGHSTTEAPPNGGANDRTALRSDEMNKAIGLLNGKKDYGELKDQQGLKDCLDAHNLPSGDPLGVSPVTLDGKNGIAALVGAGTQTGHWRVIVVEPTCSADNPGEIMANTEVP
jgi:hypothetical protein